MTPRITVCTRADGTFEILVNEAGRDLLVNELQKLSQNREHCHIAHVDDTGMRHTTDVPLSNIPYRDGDICLLYGKVLLRPDDWDRTHYPHVLV